MLVSVIRWCPSCLSLGFPGSTENTEHAQPGLHPVHLPIMSASVGALQTLLHLVARRGTGCTRKKMGWDGGGRNTWVLHPGGEGCVPQSSAPFQVAGASPCFPASSTECSPMSPQSERHTLLSNINFILSKKTFHT